ncbi:hypothetical protein FA95DRAFT_1667922 [Auriscalpium vulgare]|uniref:Uncharacterized protein n=1 Tax=Auriscalpium vulgare TaxID=40419 RepID=A0ACB8R2V7_9AGAM|nr:hypothetical protein FA95DRAFT_1667922 [Auriscalpium vulgare]
MAKYTSTQPKWKGAGAEKARKDRSDKPFVVDSFADDNDDIDLVNDARARAREAVSTLFSLGSGSYSLPSEKARKDRSDKPFVVDSFADDNDDIDLVNDARARAREAALSDSMSNDQQVDGEPASRVTGQGALSTPARMARKPAARPANKRAQATSTGISAAQRTDSPASGATSSTLGQNAGSSSASTDLPTHPPVTTSPALPSSIYDAPSHVNVAAANTTAPPAAIANAVLPVSVNISASSQTEATTSASGAGGVGLAATSPAHVNSLTPVAPTHSAPSPPSTTGGVSPAATPLAHTTGAWPADIEVVLPTETQSHMSIKAQTARIKKVLKRAIQDALPRKLFFLNTFPQPQERTAFYRGVLVAAAEAEGDADVVSRLQSDKDYAAALAKIPEARTSNLRGKLKDAADGVVRGAYKIDEFPHERHVRILKWLLAEEDALYIFPGDAKESTYDDSLPYGHGAIIMVIRMAFFGPKAIAKFPPALFRGDDGVMRLPPVMVAACATAVEAGLRAFLLGPDAVQVDFSGAQFIHSYLNHIATLQDLKSEGLGAYNALLAILYTSVMGIEGNEASTTAVGTSNRRVNAARVAQALGSA